MYRRTIGTAGGKQSDFVAAIGVNGAFCHIRASDQIPGLVPRPWGSRSYEMGKVEHGGPLGSWGSRSYEMWQVEHGRRAAADGTGRDRESGLAGTSKDRWTLDGTVPDLALVSDMARETGSRPRRGWEEIPHRRSAFRRVVDGAPPVYRRTTGTARCAQDEFVAETGVYGAFCHIRASDQIPGLVPRPWGSPSYESGQGAGGRTGPGWTVVGTKVDKAPATR